MLQGVDEVNDMGVYGGQLYDSCMKQFVVYFLMMNF